MYTLCSGIGHPFLGPSEASGVNLDGEDIRKQFEKRLFDKLDSWVDDA